MILDVHKNHVLELPQSQPQHILQTRIMDSMNTASKSFFVKFTNLLN